VTEAFYFGSDSKPLFGIHQSPSARVRAGHGVVLCYPFGREYVRAHRSFRQLAVLLTRSGVDVLRFDYFGTGDSGGGSEDRLPSLWMENIVQAAEELRRRSSAEFVSLLGLRLGATLASSIAVTADDIENLVLWDPVLNGANYSRELQENQYARLSEAIEELPVDPSSYRRARDKARTVSAVDSYEAAGFRVSAGFRRELESLDLVSGEAPAANRILLLETTESKESAELESHLAGRSRSFVVNHQRTRPVWQGAHDATVPGEVLRTLASWLSEAA